MPDFREWLFCLLSNELFRRAGMVSVWLWRSEDNLQETVVSSLHVDSGNQTLVLRLDTKYLYLLSPFTCLPCPQSHVPKLTLNSYVAEDDFEILIFLPPPLKCWDYRCIHQMAYGVLGMEPPDLCAYYTSTLTTKLCPSHPPIHTDPAYINLKFSC